VNDPITQELEHRLQLWQTVLEAGGAEHIRPQRLRELGIYGGAQGIWVDKTRTGKLSPDGTGVSVGLLHTGRSYPDDLSDDGVIYHYPSTERPPGRDLAEVNSTKAAGTLELPLFVITPGASSVERRVHLGWVEAWDDRAKLFLISFSGSRPRITESDTDEDGLFELTSETPRRKAEIQVRQGQQRFKFWVIKRYGPSCAACGIDVLAF
jgi:putative restriction endonuclease